MQIPIIFAGLFGASAVIIGALVSHASNQLLDNQQLTWMETALKYQIWHGLAIFGAAIARQANPTRFFDAACYLFISGTFLFCGSLYLLALTGWMHVAKFTPIGGMLFILAWLCIAAGGFKKIKH